MTSYLKNAPAGFVGGVSRPGECNIEPGMLVALSAVFAQRFGEAMRYVTGGIQQFTASLTKADFAGVLVRGVPQQAASSASDSDASGAVPNPDAVQDLLVRGYVMVKCTAGTPARGGVVYVRTVAATDRPIGAFEAESDSGNSFALDAVQATWASDGVDASLMAELRVAR